MLRLCSNSQSRALLLQKYGIEFIQSGVDFDEESVGAKSAKSFVYEVAKGKYKKAIERFGKDEVLLVADTVIEASSGEILRKAKDKADARRILETISANSITIITASILKNKKLEFVDISTTSYLFAPFDKRDLEAYLESNEWEGKAGACMVEGFCKKYIQKVQGLESNAMGLPVEKIRPWLEFE